MAGFCCQDMSMAGRIHCTVSVFEPATEPFSVVFSCSANAETSFEECRYPMTMEPSLDRVVGIDEACPGEKRRTEMGRVSPIHDSNRLVRQS
jgi:hypothetical protein